MKSGKTASPKSPMLIYNLFPLLGGNCLQWKGHINRAAQMGFNWLFVNPINYPGLSGSLYSTKDYFLFHPLIADPESPQKGESQIKETISSAHKSGMKVMIDLVINHCAVDSPLLQEHPQWFEWEKKGKVSHPFCMEDGKKVSWGDLAKFDHRKSKDKEGLFLYFFKVVNYLLELGFDGFRCDAAYQIPSDFWKRLIKETRSRNKSALFFAETLGCSADQTRKTASAGFDYIFNSSKWWDFHSHWLMEHYSLTRDISPSISFPESHDTERLAQELDGNVDGIKQRYLFSALFSSGVMMPMGFEFGFRRKTHVVKSRPEDWEETGLDLTSYIKQVNQIKTSTALFQEEAPTEILFSNNPNVLVLWKASTKTAEESLLILNKDIRNKQYFYSDNLYDYVQNKSPLVDISPEYPLDYIPTPFNYDLRPGQGIVLVNKK